MGFPYLRILCPVQFDDNSLKALDEGIAIARAGGSTIILLYVVPLVVQIGEVPIPPELYEDQRKEAKSKLAKIAESKLAAVPHQVVIYTGDVARCILDAAAKYNADLLVMATHGRSGLAHLFLGSVTEAVVRKATCPVLTIRAGGEPA